MTPAPTPAKSRLVADGERKLRKIALSYPQAVEDHPWGHSAFKVKKKTFLFLAVEGGELSLSVKLPESGTYALMQPYAKPTEYGLGKSGWVTARFGRKHKPPLPLLERWIDESYRAIAPGKLVATLCLLLAVLAASASAQDLPELKKRGTLRVIVDSSNLKERFNLGPGEPGLEKEMLLNFAALQQMKLETVVVERIEDRLSSLNAGKGDVVAGTVVTESRRRQVAFTSEVLPSRHVVITRRPSPPVTSLAALRSLRVGATRGSSWAEAALAVGVPAASLDDSYRTPEEMLQGLRSGRVSAAVMTAVWAILERKRDPELELGLFIGEASTVGFAVRKNGPLLLASLDDYVLNLRKTATWSRLVVKYFGENALEILKKSRAE